MSALRLAPVSKAPTNLAPVKSAVTRAPERLAPSSVARCICAAKMFAVREARSAEIGFHEPRLIENCPVELCVAKFGLIEPRTAQDGTGEIEAGKVESGQLFAGEIGGLARCCRGNGGLDVP